MKIITIIAKKNTKYLSSWQKNRTKIVFTLSVGHRLAIITADTQHCPTVVTSQTVAVKQNAAQGVSFDNVHSLLAEVADVRRRGFPQDQRLGILWHHTYIITISQVQVSETLSALPSHSSAPLLSISMVLCRQWAYTQHCE